MSSKNFSKELLSVAIEAGGNFDSTQSSSNPKSNNEDVTWLKSAMTDIASAHGNLVTRLKQCLQILQASEHDKTITVDEIENAMDEISSLCEDVDLACDFYKIGGFSLVFACLDHDEQVAQSGAANIFATVCQNNEFCQNKVIEEKVILEKLLSMTETNTTDGAVAIKAMYAVSCIVRQSDIGFQGFVAADGFSYLLKAMHSCVKKLQLKSMFFLRSLCRENPISFDYITSKEQVQLFIEILRSGYELDIVEFVLDLLIYAACQNVSFRDICLEVKLNFHGVISELTQNTTIQEDRPEIIAYCQQFSKILGIAI